MKRLRPLALLLLGSSGVSLFGYVALRFAAYSWKLGFTELRPLAATGVLLVAGWFAFLALLLVVETRIGFLRARRDARDEKARRTYPRCAYCGKPVAAGRFCSECTWRIA